ncbi:cellulase family glycosylhydrolase [Mycobacterium sp. Root265]|uniref:cellulase family glycosylhydrolase n=1 Tax=Mycobacterium sp. Root265 TaxID=1736504 RepID=UPI0009E69E23|nr:cellulase family glycosylhydrolase [Mycobacterium sp. Root265]
MRKPARRSVQRRTIVTVSAAVVLATVCATTEQRPPISLRAASYAVDMVAAIEETPTTIGLADSNLVRLDDEDLINKQLDMMQALGVQNVRIGISWISTQLTEDGNFFWGATDYVINEAHRRGMGVLGVLHETPAWAGSPPLSGVPNLDAFGRFAGAVAERYEGKVSALEVWNEPNGRFFLNPVDPAAYTSMVKAAYTAIKAFDDPDDPDDDITVVAGVLGSGRTVGNDFTMNPIDFLQGMYDADAHGFFDAFSFHPYHYDIPFSEGATQSDSPILQLRAIRELMEQYGDGDLKVWASEYGLPTTPFDPTHPLLYNSPEKQAEFLADFLASWQREDGTGPIFIYSTRDINTGSTSDQDNFGIWYTDWSEKPAVQVIRDFLEDLEPDNPIWDAIRQVVSRVVEITGEVINGVVDAIVWGVEAFIDATVWVVKTIAEVTVNVVEGIVDITSKVVHGIADAIVNSVNWVVEKVKSCLGIESTAPAQNRMMAAATVLTVDDPAKEEDTPAVPENPADPEVVEPTAGDAEVVTTEGVDTQPVDADIVEPDATVEPEVAEPEVTETEVPVTAEPEATETEAPAPPSDDVTEEPDAEEAEQEPAEEAETAPPVTARTTTTTRTAKTAKAPKTAASSGVK